MMAAISAARLGADVTVLEHMDRIGKKILSTGNGKCNYTNRKQGFRCYRSENPAFVLPSLQQFGFEETVAFFKSLGIVPKERNGYFYPASGQASSVLDVLRMELRRLNVTIQTNCAVAFVRKHRQKFEIKAGNKIFVADKCIFACGGKAFPKSGSDGSAFCQIERLGHTFVSVVPALVQMRAKPSFFPSIAGIRTDAVIHLFVDEKEAGRDRGELQALIGFFPKKLIPVLLKENEISLHIAAADISKDKIKRLSHYLKHMTFELTGTEGFDKAQTCAGGVSTAEIHADTMESSIVSGLYFAGEVIDVDGICGGYNLQWAWSSGYVAGTHAARN